MRHRGVVAGRLVEDILEVFFLESLFVVGGKVAHKALAHEFLQITLGQLANDFPADATAVALAEGLTEDEMTAVSTTLEHVVHELERHPVVAFSQFRDGDGVEQLHALQVFGLHVLSHIFPHIGVLFLDIGKIVVDQSGRVAQQLGIVAFERVAIGAAQLFANPLVDGGSESRVLLVRNGESYVQRTRSGRVAHVARCLVHDQRVGRLLLSVCN